MSREDTAPDATDTDPSDAAAATDPGAPPPPISEGEVLVAGLRRNRAPAKLAPRIQASSDGEQGAAYYAEPKGLAKRVETPEPEPAVEIATEPSSEPAALSPTVTIPRAVPRSRAKSIVVGGIAIATVLVCALAWLGQRPDERIVSPAEAAAPSARSSSTFAVPAAPPTAPPSTSASSPPTPPSATSSFAAPRPLPAMPRHAAPARSASSPAATKASAGANPLAPTTGSPYNRFLPEGTH